MNRIFSFITLTTIIFLTINMQAQHYWVGGSGNWTDYTNHWATTSGGTTFHIAEPTQDDDVVFDSNSFTAIGQTISFTESNSFCNSFDCSSIQNFPSFNADPYKNINFYGSLTLSTDAIYNFYGVYLRSSETGNTITSNGADYGSNSTVVIYNGGEFDLEDNITCNTFEVISGILNTNNHTLNIEWSFNISSSPYKEVNLGSSNINCYRWYNNSTNLTLNSGASTIHCNMMSSDVLESGPYNYNDLIFNEGSSIFTGTSSFNTINASETAGSFLKFEPGITITCNEFILIADRHNPTDMYLQSEGDFATILVNSGTVDLAWVIMKDIHATGGATFNVNPGMDLGNNTGWNFTAIEPLNYYWVGNGGNWNDLSHWATTSGGSTYYTEETSQFDNVIFDENSFSSNAQIVTLDVAAQLNDLDFSAVDESMTFNATTYQMNLYVFGSLDINDLVYKNISALLFYSPNAVNIQPGATGFINNFNFWGGGIYNIQSDIECSSLQLLEGTVNTNDFTIDCNYSFRTQNFNASVFNLGSSDIYCQNFIMQDSENTIDSGTSTIHVSQNFEGANFDYNHVIIGQEGAIFQSNSFETLEFAPGAVCQLEAGETQTASNIIIQGTSNEPIIINSSVAGQQSMLSQSSGTVTATFVTLKDNNAIGGATFNATQAIDNGNNTGWNIEELQPHDFYWVGGSGNWSDAQNHWATTSGGSTFYNYIPGGLDNVYFDQYSFTSDNQEVSVDLETINCNTIDWTGATNNPSFLGSEKTLNISGSLIFIENMYSNVTNYNFFGTEINEINAGGDAVLDYSTYFHFDGSGTWNLNSNLTVRSFEMESGTFNTNDYDVNVDFSTYFYGVNAKTINLGSSNYHTRTLSWYDTDGDNLTINGQNSHITFSSAFSPDQFGNGEQINLYFNDIQLIVNASDQGQISGEISMNNLTLDPGTTLRIYSYSEITFNQLIAQGTANDIITIKGTVEGAQASIIQVDGTVDGEYLDLKDVAASGGAEFYANNSLNSGNVSGWIFTGIAQTIDFPQIDDVLETVGTVNVSASSSSGLLVEYNLISGPATLDGSILTITGAGEIQIQATQAGDSEYNPAPSQTVNFCSNPLPTTISEEIGIGNVQLSSGNGLDCIWHYEGGEINNTPTPTINVYEAGMYQAQTSVDGCLSTLSTAFEVTFVGIDEEENIASLIFYPNPSENLITISTPNNKTGEINIYNISGKLVLNKSYFSRINNSITLDLSMLEKGVYVIKLSSENMTLTNQLIKQ